MKTTGVKQVMKPNKVEVIWLGVKNLSNEYDLSKSTIYFWINNGYLEHTRVGKKILINRNAFEKFLQNQLGEYLND